MYESEEEPSPLSPHAAPKEAMKFARRALVESPPPSAPLEQIPPPISMRDASRSQAGIMKLEECWRRNEYWNRVSDSAGQVAGFNEAAWMLR